jgi:hypothetical protein
MRTLAYAACIGGTLRALQNRVSIVVWGGCMSSFARLDSRGGCPHMGSGRLRP